jgi:hypothetical protein
MCPIRADQRGLRRALPDQPLDEIRGHSSELAADDHGTAVRRAPKQRLKVHHHHWIGAVNDPVMAGSRSRALALGPAAEQDQIGPRCGLPRLPFPRTNHLLIDYRSWVVAHCRPLGEDPVVQNGQTPSGLAAIVVRRARADEADQDGHRR